jgi:hypothetical protein
MPMLGLLLWSFEGMIDKEGEHGIGDVRVFG